MQFGGKIQACQWSYDFVGYYPLKHGEVIWENSTYVVRSTLTENIVLIKTSLSHAAKNFSTRDEYSATVELVWYVGINKVSRDIKFSR